MKRSHTSILVSSKQKTKSLTHRENSNILTTKKTERLATDHLHHLAFDNSLLANIITIVRKGKIIEANQAACRLLGYSKKSLLAKSMNDLIFTDMIKVKQMRRQRAKAGHVIGDFIMKKKGGEKLTCHITSVEFTGDNGIKKAISTLVDLSESILRQQNIDHIKEEKQAVENLFAQSKSDAALSRLGDLELKLDKEITAKEEIRSYSLLQQQFFKKEWEEETKLKKIQIAEAIVEGKETERSDIGKELHDNVNQLLVASRLYLDIARRNRVHRELHLSRSSEYMLTAIEEIRKLTKGLINDAIESLGLCDAIHNIIRDLMEVYPIKISCTMDEDIRKMVNTKFNINLFRIVQEQLNNIIKHANASAVKIDLSQTKAAILLSISDNGSGFDTSQKGKGIGISNIKSRAELYKGNAVFVSKPGKGCVLTVTFPDGDADSKESMNP